jgi:hypothetical protein
MKVLAHNVGSESYRKNGTHLYKIQIDLHILEEEEHTC